MRSLPLSVLFAVVPSLLAAACGGATPAPTEPTAVTTTGAPATSGTPAAASDQATAPAAWSKDLSHDQQIAFMKAKVVPAMKPVFQTQDATHYAEFSCKTCHGPEFKDPHEFLPHLTLAGGKLTAFTEKPDMSKFMAEKVVGNMATAMGEPAYDPKTNQGFGCGGCHAIDKK